MVTFAVGQMLYQHSNGRIWRIIAPATPRLDSPRWQLELVTPSTRDERIAGERTVSSESWCNANCEDYPSKVDPPVGDGVQHVRICDSDGLTVTEGVFQRSTDAVAYIEFELGERANTDLHAAWFGWAVDDDSRPDLIAVIDDGALRWTDASS